MKTSFFDRRWIRIGFNLGLGIIIAVAMCYTIAMVGIMSIVGILTMAKHTGPGLFTSSILVVSAVLGLFLLFVIPAIIGKSSAQAINFLRMRKLPQVPEIPKE